MTDPVPTQIRIALFDDNGEGDRFFLDVCGMLEALAQRAGVPLRQENIFSLPPLKGASFLKSSISHPQSSIFHHLRL